jgi:hypothetical protein
MKKVYVCSPVRGDQNDPTVIRQNLARAVLYSRTVYKSGCLPICSQIYLERATGLNEVKNPSCREEALIIGLELLTLCNELWVFGRREGEESEGMKNEIKQANRLALPVVYRTEYLPDWEIW